MVGIGRVAWIVYVQSMRLRVIHARCGLGNILQHIIDLKA